MISALLALLAASCPLSGPVTAGPLPAQALRAACLRVQGGDTAVVREAVTMGTRLRLSVEAASRVQASEAAEGVVAEIERLDRVLTTWDPAGPMSRLNRSEVGRAYAPGEELFGLLAEAWDWVGPTVGAFTPGVGALVDAWDLRGEGRRPTGPELDRARDAAGPDAFALDRAAATVTRRVPGAWMDTGAFGKGAALRAVARLLRKDGVRRAFVDLGGQVLAWDAPGCAPWTVQVAHPLHREEPVARLRLAGVSAATSGTSERWVEVDGVRLGHILDPRSGRPAPAWGSVTVVSSDPFVADVLSTALYVMGPDEGMAWAEARARDRDDLGVLFLIVGKNGLEARWNAAMERWLDVSSLQPQPKER